MAERQMYTYEELLDQVKQCGQSIIDNAESILGNERYFLNCTVSFDIFRSRAQLPAININRNFVPELQIENIETYKEIKLRKDDKKK